MRRIAIKSDQDVNEVLREESQLLRGCMANAAERQPLPDRFTAEPDVNRPAMIITDHATGRQATVALFAYRGARQMLTELFA